jgi:hypothetical protein
MSGVPQTPKYGVWGFQLSWARKEGGDNKGLQVAAYGERTTERMSIAAWIVCGFLIVECFPVLTPPYIWALILQALRKMGSLCETGSLQKGNSVKLCVVGSGWLRRGLGIPILHKLGHHVGYPTVARKMGFLEFPKVVSLGAPRTPRMAFGDPSSINCHILT